MNKLRLFGVLISMSLLAACAAPAAAPAPASTSAPAATSAPATTAEATTAATASAETTTAPATEATVAPTTEAATAATGATTGTTGQGACTTEAMKTEMATGKLRLVIGTGGTGGVFYPYGGGLARILTEKRADTEATAEVTGGSVDNMKLVQKGEADIGMSTIDSAYLASIGDGPYKDTGAVPACTIATLYTSFVHVVALDGSGVNDLPDMKGKRVSVGSAGSSTEAIADRLLEAGGLDPKADVTRDNLSVAESVAAMKDQKIDAFFWIGGLPTAAVTDLMNTPNVKVKFLPLDKYLEPLRSKFGPVYTPFTLKQDVYANLPGDVPGIGIGNILFVNANMPEQLAYDIIKTMFDNLADVQQVHPEAKSLALETAAQGSSIPFHPGAIKFFTEKGVWKP